MRSFGVLICGVVFAVTACGSSKGHSSRASEDADYLPKIMTDNGFTCDDTVDTQAPDFYGGTTGVPHRKLDCNKGGDTGTTVRFFIWDEGEAADEAFYSDFADQFCGSDQNPTYVVGDGWGATVTTRNATDDATIIDPDGMSEVTDVVGGKITSPFC